MVTSSKLKVAKQMIAELKTIQELCSTVGIPRSTLYRSFNAAID